MSDLDDAAELPRLSLPSLLLVTVLVGLGVRYFFFPSRSSSSAANAATGEGRGTSSRDRVDAQAVEHVAQVLPQLDRRAIAWDLRRRGGGAAACVERALAGGGALETVRRTLSFLRFFVACVGRGPRVDAGPPSHAWRSCTIDADARTRSPRRPSAPTSHPRHPSHPKRRRAPRSRRCRT